jgi:hypothetical protein
MSIQYPLLILLSTLLAACSPPRPHPFIDQNGKTAYLIECKHTQDECQTVAKEMCPNGYTTLKSLSSPITYFMHGKTGETQKYDLIIECH